jgi:Transport protein particle (TRAPP) component
VSQEVVHGGAVQFESMGHGVGYRLTERLCQAKALSGESLEAVKFICKDLWGETFKKQVCAHRCTRHANCAIALLKGNGVLQQFV